MKRMARKKVELVVVFLISTSLILGLQVASGAYTAELETHPDEPTHAVSGIMVGEYLRSGLGSHPVRFAENYYVHYPRVGIGHWPPGFYLLIGVWSLAFSTAPASLLVLMALIGAVATTALFALVRSEFSLGLAVGSAFAWMLLPLVRGAASTIMPDLLIAALCLLAAETYRRYLADPSVWSACLFGGLASMALLTRGDAVVLALVPPVAVLLTQRFGLLRRWDFWAPAGIVVSIAGPWYYGAGKWFASPYGSSINRAFGLETQGASPPVRWGAYPANLGWGLAAVCATGLLIWGLRRERRTPAWATAASLTVGLMVCRVALDEHNEARYLLTGLAGLLFGLPCFAAFISERLRSAASPRWAAPAVFVGALLLPAGPNWMEISKARHWGLRDLARTLADRPGANGQVVMVSGLVEGPLIAEAAMLQPKPETVFLRATKIVGYVTWNGVENGSRFESADDLAEYLDAVAVSVVVLDHRTPNQRNAGYQELLRQALDSGGDKWGLVSGDSPVAVYHRTGPAPVRQSPIEIDMKWRMGRSLQLGPDSDQ